jgi:hypothetical protein
MPVVKEKKGRSKLQGPVSLYLSVAMTELTEKYHLTKE